MTEAVRQLLKPEILNTVNGLELIARILVEGFMSGSNRSQSIGAGQEFSQYRSYEPGDDLRQLDWKMFARSERYYIKQAEIESNITVKFILDSSHSMSYSEKDLSKFQYAKIMIAALAYLARKQSDAFGLFAINNNKIRTVLPRYEQQQFMRFLHELILAVSEGTWKQGNGLEQLYDHQGKELILFMTDLYDDSEDLYTFISKLKTSRNEVIVFHLLGKDEQDFGTKGSFVFEDLETGQRIKVDTPAQQKLHASSVKEWIKTSRNRLLEMQVNYQQVLMDEPIEKVLQSFLTVRKNLLR